MRVSEMFPSLYSRLDEVVAGVEVARVLEREREPAGLRVDAQARRLADPVGERDVEHLHVHLADVAAHPLLEDVDQEAAVLLGRHRAVRDQLTLLLVAAAGLRHEDHGTSPSVASETRSMMGMNWTKLAPHSSRRKR